MVTVAQGDAMIDTYDAVEVEQSCCSEEHYTEKKDSSEEPTNEYVLNVAFFSFVLFLSVQAVFAIIANSEAMLADCEAMSVDAVTYLFNLCAERIKNRPLQPSELALPAEVRIYRRELQRLYLELIPPTISVLTLIAVTILTLREAFSTLSGNAFEDGVEETVSVPIMLLFSGANLLLDIINVTCFARAHSAFGLDVVRKENESIRKSMRKSYTRVDSVDESAALLPIRRDIESQEQPAGEPSDGNHEDITRRSRCEQGTEIINLNMCSAWTHVCADTLRSVAVLVAAAIAFLIPSVDGSTADAVAAIAVSFIILGSLLPLLQGLVLTVVQICVLSRNPPHASLQV